MTKHIIILAVMVIAIILAIVVGPAPLDRDILQLRVSRIVLGIFAGGIMAFCGCVLQGLFGNPLVEPYTLGSASGAALGGAIGMVLFGTLSPVFSFCGALGVGILVYSIARIEGGILRDRLILAGVIMSFLCSSLVMIIMVMGGRELYEILYLLMGYLGIIIDASNRVPAIVIIVCSLVCVVFVFRYHRELDIVTQGTETAASLGINIQNMSIMIFIFTAVLVGLTVSLVGAIGFVGLVIPHIAKLLFGPRHLHSLPASFVLGAAFLLLADTLARTITVYELPVGVVTSIIGVPFFIYLYKRVGRNA